MTLRNVIVVGNLVAGSADASKLTAQVAGKRIDLATATLGAVTIASGKVTVPVTALLLAPEAAHRSQHSTRHHTHRRDVVGTATVTAPAVGKGKA